VPARAVRLFLAALAALALAACSDPETPEEQVRALIDAGEEAVEGRDVSAVLELVSPDFRDARARDRDALRRLLAGQFLTHPSIHLLVQTDEIRFPAPERAEVLLYVAMTGTRVDSAAALAGVDADLYRLDLELALADDAWQVTGGAWRRVTAADFLR
jgi:hypothetical protein